MCCSTGYQLAPQMSILVAAIFQKELFTIGVHFAAASKKVTANIHGNFYHECVDRLHFSDLLD